MKEGVLLTVLVFADKFKAPSKTNGYKPIDNLYSIARPLEMGTMYIATGKEELILFQFTFWIYL